MEIKNIKAHLGIITILTHYGLKPNKNHMLNCPFHEDTNASLKIYSKTNTFNCFGCGKNGDVIEFIQQKENCTKHEALLKATELCGVSKPLNKEPSQTEQPMQNHNPILDKLFKSFQNGLNKGMTKKPKEYLQQRSLDLTKLEIGYNSGQFHHHGKLNEKDMEACIVAGLLIPYNGKTPYSKGQSYTAFAKDCIIFPLKNKNGEIVSIYGRSIINNSKSSVKNGTGKHYYLKERQGVYPNYPKPTTTKLILTEAIIDAATLLQYINSKDGLQSVSTSILALFGTNGLTEEHIKAIKELQNLQEIIFFFDGDKAGTEAISKHEKTLKELRPEIELSTVITPDNEDINSLLIGHDPEIFTHLIEQRIPLMKKVEKEVLRNQLFNEEAKNQKVQTHCRASQNNHLNTTNPDYITFTTQELLMILLGGINLQQLDRLRTTLKVSRKDTGDPLHSIRHTLDLYHSDYLEKFINKASEQLEIGTNIIRRAIAELTEQIETYRLNKIESQKQQKPKQRQLSEQRYKKAKNYLSAPKLMQRTNKDIGKTGMIGEENNRLLMYLVFTSRMREQPLHIISLGGSGTGKTYLQEKISELIPEQDKKEITILSENAFYYFDRKELKHKLILIEDLDGAMEVLYPLRELQSKKWISKTLPIKDHKGEMKTVSLVVEGPICLAGTTTKERLYEDNSNRSLLIYLDSSKEHKEAIMDYQRKLSAGKINTKEENEIKEFFKDMQTVLKPIAVRNPYAEYLKLPEYIFKPLRTNAHYLATIETITFYHQYQREIKTDKETGERYIETTLEDIQWANKLLKEVLLAKADELSGECRKFFERLKKWMEENKKESFYKNEIRDEFRMNPNNLKYYLSVLSRYNRIKIVGGSRYKSGYEYEVINIKEYRELNTNLENALDMALEKIRNKK